MLPQDVQITAYADQYGWAYAGVYSDTGTPYKYNTDPGDTNSVTNSIEAIAAIPAGTDKPYGKLFGPTAAYFVLGVLDYNSGGSTGTLENLQIRVLSYPLKSLFLF